jgi:hypothetical protein
MENTVAIVEIRIANLKSAREKFFTAKKGVKELHGEFSTQDILFVSLVCLVILEW